MLWTNYTAYVNIITMRSPAEQLLAKASEQIDDKERIAELGRKKQTLIGNIDQACNVIRDEVALPSYAVSDGEILDVVVKRKYGSRVGPGERIELLISGQLSRDTSGTRAQVPMYKIVKELVASDTMAQPSRYEIQVADPESENGYSLLASAAERKSHYDSSYSHFSGILTPEQLKTMQTNHGFYADPRAPAMLDEVHGILDLAIAQQQEATARPAIAA